MNCLPDPPEPRVPCEFSVGRPICLDDEDVENEMVRVLTQAKTNPEPGSAKKTDSTDSKAFAAPNKSAHHKKKGKKRLIIEE
jgi:hypothetical protein